MPPSPAVSAAKATGTLRTISTIITAMEIYPMETGLISPYLSTFE